MADIVSRLAELKQQVQQGKVAEVEIGSDGNISGKLKDGAEFRSAFPTALQDPEFAELLDQQNVTVRAVQAQTSFGQILLTLVALGIAAFGAYLFIVGSRFVISLL